jgi:hypothetical protein
VLGFKPIQAIRFAVETYFVLVLVVVLVLESWRVARWSIEVLQY